MENITRSYTSYQTALDVVRSLKDAGFKDDNISIVSRSSDGSMSQTDGDQNDISDDAATGATSGGILGAGLGLLTGLGMMAIPGVGPVVAAGWLATTATGAIAGAAAGGLTGGLVGALMERGVSEDDSHVYAENVKRGGSIVSVSADEAHVDRVETIMDGFNPINSMASGSEYRKEGWSKFDSASSHNNTTIG